MTSLLKIKKPNILDFYEIRQSFTPPLHFVYINIPLQYNLEETIIRWIKNNLKGRFYVGQGLYLNKEDNIDTALKIGFEEPKELSYFTLACPLLKYK